MSLSVGTIESYVPGSTELEQTQYSDLGAQERDALNLSDSNLWLVDSTTLNQLDTGELSLMAIDFTSSTDDGQGYLAPMSSTSMYSTTGDITVYGSDPTADNILYTSDPTLQLSNGAPLTQVQSGGQSSPTSLLSSDGSSLSTGTIDSFSSLTGSGTTTTGFGSAGSTSITGSGDSASEPSSPPSEGTETSIISNSSTETESGSSPTTTPGEIKAAPFELHSAFGLLLLAIIILIRRKGRRPHRHPIDAELSAF